MHKGGGVFSTRAFVQGAIFQVQFSSGAIILGSNCPGGNYPGGAIFLGGNCSGGGGGQLFVEQSFRGQFSSGAIILEVNCSGGNYLGGNHPGGNCPGFSFPRGELYGHPLNLLHFS